MGQLLLFLFYAALITGFVWQLIRVIRDPWARTVPRLAFVLAAGALLTFIMYFGVLQ